MTRDNETVAAVIALAAEHDDLPPREGWKTRANKFGDGASGVFHQRKAWDAIALGGKAVNFARFRGAENFHDGESIRTGHFVRDSICEMQSLSSCARPQP